MIVYYAGLRLSDMRIQKRYPSNVLFSFDDVGPYGDGEQSKLLRGLVQYRGRRCVSTSAVETVTASTTRN